MLIGGCFIEETKRQRFVGMLHNETSFRMSVLEVNCETQALYDEKLLLFGMAQLLVSFLAADILYIDKFTREI